MVINAKRAIVLIIKDKVKMLEKYSENIRSVQNSFDLPSVIRLNFYVHFEIINHSNDLYENGNDQTIVYMAFAHAQFKYANAH